MRSAECIKLCKEAFLQRKGDISEAYISRCNKSGSAKSSGLYRKTLKEMQRAILIANKQ